MTTVREQAALAATRAAFCATFDIAEVADDADLFTLGGDSLSFLEVVLELDAALGFDLPEEPLIPMLDAQRCTVGELAAVVERARRERR
jgi:acyl carrier protein